jgi:hypothetical protein
MFLNIAGAVKEGEKNDRISHIRRSDSRKPLTIAAGSSRSAPLLPISDRRMLLELQSSSRGVISRRPATLDRPLALKL